MRRSTGSVGFTLMWWMAVSVASVGCNATDERAQSRSDPPSTSAEPTRGPHRFDPAQVQSGDTVAGLTVTSVDLSWVGQDSVYVGSVRFAGEIQVRGTYRALYDDPEPSQICFHVDPASAAKIPRMLHDERNVWFCFANQQEAEWLLGPPHTSGRATVRIDEYRTTYQFTDAFDTARLLRVVERSEISRQGAGPVLSSAERRR